MRVMTSRKQKIFSHFEFPSSLYVKTKIPNLFIRQDRYLPIANIARIMKNTLPENAKIAKDSKETVQECVSEFISFITSEASDKCLQEKRKTINGDDLLWAMSTLGFDKYVEPLKLYLSKYREAVRGDKPDKAAARASANAASAANASAASANVNVNAGGVAGQTKS
jgi:nuclear transcription Y subunit beta